MRPNSRGTLERVRLAARPAAVVGFGLSFAMASSGALGWLLDLVSPPTRSVGSSMGESALFIAAVGKAVAEQLVAEPVQADAGIENDELVVLRAHGDAGGVAPVARDA